MRKYSMQRDDKKRILAVVHSERYDLRDYNDSHIQLGLVNELREMIDVL